MVVTVVHHPLDARIWHRQIAAMRQEGWGVTYAAPWTGYGVEPPTDLPGLTCLDVPRAHGRSRWQAQVGARRVLRDAGPSHDLVLIHDPELLLATARRGLPPVVWDVHEDPAAAVQSRPWVPGPLRGLASAAVRAVEAWAERRHALVLADHHYAARFGRPHPVVPNTTFVVPHPLPAGTPGADGRRRVVYLGSITIDRGAREMVEVGRRLRGATGGEIRLEIIGPAHGPAGAVVAAAHAAGDVHWAGFVPNDVALPRLDGALAGLSLLHDAANFRPSMPTKVIEYLAHAVPVISTPLPVPAELVTRSGAGVLVPFGDVERTVAQILDWGQNPDAAARTGLRGHQVVAADYDWDVVARRFVGVLEAVRTQGRREPGPPHGPPGP